MSEKQPGKSRIRSSNAIYHLTESQLKKLTHSAKSGRNELIIHIFIETGIRRFELAFLKIEDLDFQTQMLTIGHGKGDKTRTIPMTASLLKKIRLHCGNRTNGYLFLSRNGNHLSLRQLNRIVAATGICAGIRNPNPRQKYISCHLLRHSFAYLWKKNGGSIETLSVVLGHTSVKTSWDLYGRQGLDEIKENYYSTMQRVNKKRK